MAVTTVKADELADIRHGFFTRLGGVSTGIYEGLNCGAGSDDLADAVAENRARVAAEMDVARDALVSVHQIHSPDVVTVTEAPTGDKPKCDAMVTATPGIALGILTADCAPILFADASAGVVGAAHAGWKGALGGVAQNTVAAMEALGAKRADIAAVIGPCISQRSYEVGPEFIETFMDEDPEFARFFAGGAGDRAQFDLPGFLLHALRDLGVGQAAWTGHCTYADAEKFFSYRRTTHHREPDYGRQISVIRI